jgi:hypothetical protein
VVFLTELAKKALSIVALQGEPGIFQTEAIRVLLARLVGYHRIMGRRMSNKAGRQTFFPQLMNPAPMGIILTSSFLGEKEPQ